MIVKMAGRKRGNLLTAFNLVPLVEQVLQDREVECVTSWERNLYVGTTDGLILYYGLVDGVTPLGKKVYQSKLKCRKQLDSDKRKSVQQLTVIPAMNRLLALVDGFLYLLDMQRLEIIDAKERLNKISCYCINESKSVHQMTSAEITIAQQKKKSIQFYTLSNDRFIPGKEISLSDLPVSMARDGDNLCVALSSQHFSLGRYILINLGEGGEIIELPPYDIGATPIVKRTARDQFLINTGDVGVVVTSTGTSDRPPIDWSSRRPFAAALMFPYLLTFSKATSAIYVFSLLDQQCVQELSFMNGKYFGLSYGKLIAAVSTSVYLLSPVPLKEQVTYLLEKQFVEEAILLAETVAALEEIKNPEKADEYISGIKQKAAFIYFAEGQYSKMESLLLEGFTDPREVICKFEGLLLKSSTFISQIDVPTADVLDSSGQISLKEAKKFLIRYLKDVRTTTLAVGIREEIDTALIKLIAEDQPSSVVSYISNHEVYLDFEETKTAFKKYGCYHALGLLYYYNGNVDKMMKIVTDIYDGKLVDVNFPGFDYIVDFLKQSGDMEILKKYSPWVLDHDEVKGVTLFTEYTEKSIGHVGVKPDVILDLLTPYIQATLLYLEHIIYQTGSEEEPFHTRLGSLYLDEVLKLKNNGTEDELKEKRSKLKSFLETSTHYRASFLLNRVQDTDLHLECAILYGRMDEHEKALTLLAHQLQDYDGAEQYCALYSKGRSRQHCQNLYQTLLAVYLRPLDSSKPPVIKPALRLLNNNGANFDAAKVLQLLPPQWEISTVKEFLMRSLRSTTHTMRTSKIEHSLAKGEHLQTRYELMQLQGGPVIISENKLCPVCQLPFNDATAFVRYPNGIVTHLKCGRNKNICPVTGTWFGD